MLCLQFNSNGVEEKQATYLVDRNASARYSLGEKSEAKI